MPLHASITDPNIHEPKGVSSATAGRVYVSNGSGSGTWLHMPSGWGYYQHNGLAQNFTTTDAKLLINGSGPLTNTTYLPNEIRGSGQLWSTVNSRMTPIRLGDAYQLRIDLPITARTSANELTISLDIGAGATPSTVILPKYQDIAKTAPFTISVEITLVALTTTTVSNGIQFFLKTDTGNIDITNPSITIVRTHSGNI